MAIIQPYHANLYTHVKALKYQASAHAIKPLHGTPSYYLRAQYLFLWLRVFLCLYVPQRHQRTNVLETLGFVLPHV